MTAIPTTLDIFGQDFHVQAPPFTGVDSDPSSVYNFEGSVGIAFISGLARGSAANGESQTLLTPSTTCDSCRAGSKEADPSLGDPPPQVHDFNPGITQSGLLKQAGR